MSFDEEYRDEHDECRHEIESLRAQLAEGTRERDVLVHAVADHATVRGEYYQQLLSAKAHVARLVEVLRLVVKCCDEPRSRDNSEHDGLDALEAARSALSTTISLDALHEDRARECERLKNGFPQRSPLDTEAWLDREASAHRAKKGAK